MIKFKSEEDKQLFLLENRLNSLDKLDEDTFHTILRRRGKLLHILKDRKRSQVQKANWRKYKWKYLSAIRRWHRSVKGKRFHRLLGKFLAMRYFRDKITARESKLLAKALSSLRTHYYVEFEYYAPLEEELSLHLLVEELFPLLMEIESKLVNGQDLDEDEWDLLRFVSGCEISDEEINKYKDFYYRDIGSIDKLRGMVMDIYNNKYIENADKIILLSQNIERVLDN